VDGEERKTDDPLTPAVSALLAQPRRVGFYRAIEILERATPRAVRVGEEGPVGREAIRFRHDPSMSFSASDVTGITLRKRHHADVAEGAASDQYFEVTTTFLGLTGTVSPLPAYFIEEVINEDPDHPAQREFLDLFHHRVLSVFYRAHAKYSFITDYTSDSRDPWSRRALCLAGFDGFADLAGAAAFAGFADLVDFTDFAGFADFAGAGRAFTVGFPRFALLAFAFAMELSTPIPMRQ